MAGLGVERLLDATLLELCAISSPIGEERSLCEAVQARLAKLPLAAPIRRYGDSIVVPVTRGRGPRVALVGHLDTVRTENGPARIEGDRCFGSGASDMKSGLAVMIALAETLRLADLACELTLVFYAREEGPFADNELGPVLDQDPDLASVDVAVCLEPSNNRLHLGCVGSIHATVTFRGRTAHSARPWEGDNAITRAGEFLAELRALGPKESIIDGLTYRTVTTVTQAKDGGRGRNVVPDLFVLNVNRRFAPDVTLEAARADLLALVGDRAEVEFTDLSPAARPSAEHPLVRALIAAGVRAVEPKQAWTDVARFAARDVAAVNFGPGENAQAHQKNESTSLALLHEGYAIMTRWLTGL
jgi:succinyl-diaminopimelate desuccinylase